MSNKKIQKFSFAKTLLATASVVAMIPASAALGVDLYGAVANGGSFNANGSFDKNATVAAAFKVPDLTAVDIVYMNNMALDIDVAQTGYFKISSTATVGVLNAGNTAVLGGNKTITVTQDAAIGGYIRGSGAFEAGFNVVAGRTLTLKSDGAFVTDGVNVGGAAAAGTLVFDAAVANNGAVVILGGDFGATQTFGTTRLLRSVTIGAVEHNVSIAGAISVDGSIGQEGFVINAGASAGKTIAITGVVTGTNAAVAAVTAGDGSAGVGTSVAIDANITSNGAATFAAGAGGAAGVGGALSIATTGNVQLTAAGAGVQIVAGAGGANIGGAVTLASATKTLTLVGAAANNVTAGLGGATAGGAVDIAGNIDASGANQAFNVTAGKGAAAGNAGAGGAVNVTAASTITVGTAALNMTAGEGDAGVGGALNINGALTYTIGIANTATLTAGAGSSTVGQTGVGGALNINNNVTSTRNVVVKAGAGNVGIGGAVVVIGDRTITTGNNGHLAFTSGAAGAGTAAGGAITSTGTLAVDVNGTGTLGITAGASSTTARGGNISLNTLNIATANTGLVTIGGAVAVADKTDAADYGSIAIANLTSAQGMANLTITARASDVNVSNVVMTAAARHDLTVTTTRGAVTLNNVNMNNNGSVGTITAGAGLDTQYTGGAITLSGNISGLDGHSTITTGNAHGTGAGAKAGGNIVLGNNLVFSAGNAIFVIGTHTTAAKAGTITGQKNVTVSNGKFTFTGRAVNNGMIAAADFGDIAANDLVTLTANADTLRVGNVVVSGNNGAIDLTATDVGGVTLAGTAYTAHGNGAIAVTAGTGTANGAGSSIKFSNTNLVTLTGAVGANTVQLKAGAANVNNVGGDVITAGSMKVITDRLVTFTAGDGAGVNNGGSVYFGGAANKDSLASRKDITISGHGLTLTGSATDYAGGIYVGAIAANNTVTATAAKSTIRVGNITTTTAGDVDLNAISTGKIYFDGTTINTFATGIATLNGNVILSNAANAYTASAGILVFGADSAKVVTSSGATPIFTVVANAVTVSDDVSVQLTSLARKDGTTGNTGITVANAKTLTLSTAEDNLVLKTNLIGGGAGQGTVVLGGAKGFTIGAATTGNALLGININTTATDAKSYTLTGALGSNLIVTKGNVVVSSGVANAANAKTITFADNTNVRKATFSENNIANGLQYGAVTTVVTDINEVEIGTGNISFASIGAADHVFKKVTFNGAVGSKAAVTGAFYATNTALDTLGTVTIDTTNAGAISFDADATLAVSTAAVTNTFTTDTNLQGSLAFSNAAAAISGNIGASDKRFKTVAFTGAAGSVAAEKAIYGQSVTATGKTLTLGAKSVVDANGTTAEQGLAGTYVLGQGSTLSGNFIVATAAAGKVTSTPTAGNTATYKGELNGAAVSLTNGTLNMTDATKVGAVTGAVNANVVFDFTTASDMAVASYDANTVASVGANVKTVTVAGAHAGAFTLGENTTLVSNQNAVSAGTVVASANGKGNVTINGTSGFTTIGAADKRVDTVTLVGAAALGTVYANTVKLSNDTTIGANTVNATTMTIGAKTVTFDNAASNVTADITGTGAVAFNDGVFAGKIGSASEKLTSVTVDPTKLGKFAATELYANTVSVGQIGVAGANATVNTAITANTVALDFNDDAANGNPANVKTITFNAAVTSDVTNANATASGNVVFNDAFVGKVGKFTNATLNGTGKTHIVKGSDATNLIINDGNIFDVDSAATTVDIKSNVIAAGNNNTFNVNGKTLNITGAASNIAKSQLNLSDNGKFNLPTGATVGDIALKYTTANQTERKISIADAGMKALLKKDQAIVLDLGQTSRKVVSATVADNGNEIILSVDKGKVVTALVDYPSVAALVASDTDAKSVYQDLVTANIGDEVKLTKMEQLTGGDGVVAKIQAASNHTLSTVATNVADTVSNAIALSASQGVGTAAGDMGVNGGLWVRGIGYSAEQTAVTDNTSLTPAKISSFGFVGGADVGFGENAKVGVVGSISNATTTLNNADHAQNGSSVKASSKYAGAYVSYDVANQWFAKVVGLYGWHAVKDASKVLAITSTDITSLDAAGSYDTNNIIGDFSAGYRVKFDEITVAPTVRFTYNTGFDAIKYTKTSLDTATSVSQTVDQSSSGADMTFALGARVSTDLAIDNMVISPYGQIFGAKDFGSANITVKTATKGAGDYTSIIEPNSGELSYKIGGGANIKGDIVEMGLGVDGHLSNGYTGIEGAFNLRVNF